MGNIYLTWQDNRSGTFQNFSQKIDSSGEVQWQENGILGGHSVGVEEGEGGFNFVVFELDSIGSRIYLQKFDSSGNKPWGDIGVLFYRKPRVLGGNSPLRITDDSDGGAIMVFNYSEVEFGSYNIYAQKVSRNGILGEVITGVRDRISELTIPKLFNVSEPYPNPFNSSTTISYELRQKGNVHITVHNILGETVNILVDSVMPEGFHHVLWNASNVASGIYFYRLTSGSFAATKKMVLMK